jgi:hypothetical protein
MGFNMNYLERAISDGHAKFSGDANNDIQPVSKEALIGAIKKCIRPFGQATSSRRRRLYESDAMNPFRQKPH